MKFNIDRKIHNLCVKAVTGNLNEDEKRFLDKWISESAENKIEFDKIKDIWIKSELKDFPKLPDPVDEWMELDARIKNGEGIKTAAVKLKSGGSFLSGIRLKPVLSAALVILFFISIILLWNLETGGPNLKSITTGNKEHKEIKLADGSSILLNSGSRVQYQQPFDDKERKITLYGEAFFSVAKDKRPFLILTDNAAVTVLGTKFNVRSRDGKTRVYVKDGKVNLSRQNPNNGGVVLFKGQLSSVLKNEVPSPPVSADPDPQLGWMEGKLVFNQTTLPEIIDEIERFYDVQILLEDPGLNFQTLTGSFKASKVDTVLEMICLALDLDYIRQSAGRPDEKIQFLIKQN